MPAEAQQKHPEWHWQWEKVPNDDPWLFSEWIHPNRLEDFRGKTVLDCGCGGGHHLAIVASHCKKAVGVDLNTADLARRATASFPNVEVLEGDLALMDFPERFDAAYSVGVIHHTDDPTRTFDNIRRQVRPGGRVIVWVYSHEGNLLNWAVLEPLKRLVFFRLPKGVLWALSNLMTLAMYLPIYTVYLLPLPFLPFYEYFGNWRRLKYAQNNMNVFDKLNAPQTHFIREETVRSWFNSQDFADVHVSPYKGVSWRGSGTVR